MNREKWQFATHSLRNILRSLSTEDNFTRKIEYRFGLQWNPMFGFFHLYDGWNGCGTIATIKLSPETAILRYLQGNLFSHEIEKLKVEDRKTILVPSENVGRHDDWVRPRLQGRIDREIQRHEVQEREDFLEGTLPRGNSLTFTVPQIPSLSRLGQYGVMEPLEAVTNTTTTVRFPSPPTDRDTMTAEAIFRELTRNGETSIPRDLSFDHLLEIYRHHESNHMRQQEREQARQSRFSSLQNAFYGDVRAQTVAASSTNISDSGLRRLLEEMPTTSMWNNVADVGETINITRTGGGQDA